MNSVETALAATVGIAIVVLSYSIWMLWQRLNSALGGNAKDGLEASLVGYFKRVKKLEKSSEEHQNFLKRLEAQANLASQKISIVRYNPFGDTGGDQSFSLAVLDATKSGYVLTSIHGRENTRTYIKPIDGGVSKYSLSKEEKQAIEQAQKRTPRQEQQHA